MNQYPLFQFLPKKEELRTFLRAFNADSKYLVDYDEIENQAFTTASYAAYKFKNGSRPTASQIRATVGALASAKDEYARRIFKNLLDAEEFAF